MLATYAQARAVRRISMDTSEITSSVFRYLTVAASTLVLSHDLSSVSRMETTNKAAWYTSSGSKAPPRHSSMSARISMSLPSPLNHVLTAQVKVLIVKDNAFYVLNKTKMLSGNPRVHDSWSMSVWASLQAP